MIVGWTRTWYVCKLTCELRGPACDKNIIFKPTHDANVLNVLKVNKITSGAIIAKMSYIYSQMKIINCQPHTSTYLNINLLRTLI